MAGDPKNPEPGELHIDATEIAPIIVDLPSGGMQGLRREQEGFSEAYQEITANEATEGIASKARVSEEAQRLVELTGQMAQIGKFLNPARKLVELLEESQAHLDNQRHQILSAIAGVIDQRAKLKENEDLLAAYQKTRSYRSAIAVKAARTRKRNQSETS